MVDLHRRTTADPPHPEISQLMAGKNTQRLPPPVSEILGTIVCEEFDDGWGRNNGQNVTLH